MELRKDDPVYYLKIRKLIKQAKDEGLSVELATGGSIYLVISSKENGDTISIDLGNKLDGVNVGC